MKLVRIDSQHRTSYENDLFTGGPVQHQGLVGEGAPAESSSVRMQVVAFGAGARTRLHVHTVDQILVVTEGRGQVGTVDEHFDVTPGDVIHIPAGEAHYHGACVAEPMSHLTIMTPGHSIVVDREWSGPPTTV